MGLFFFFFLDVGKYVWWIFGKFGYFKESFENVFNGVDIVDRCKVWDKF